METGGGDQRSAALGEAPVVQLRAGHPRHRRYPQSGRTPSRLGEGQGLCEYAPAGFFCNLVCAYMCARARARARVCVLLLLLLLLLSIVL